MFQKDARWGEGWAGLIYRGSDSRGRSVRIIPLRHVSSDMREEITRRCSLMKELSVPGAIPALGIFTINSAPHWVSPWKEFCSLRSLMRWRMPIEVALGILDQLSEILILALQKSVVHGDIHPAAIMLSPDGRVWLDGFGHQNGQNLDLRTSPLGYVSPNGEASQAGDVYALGAILGELLSGECPLQAEDVENLHQQDVVDYCDQLSRHLADRGGHVMLSEAVRRMLSFSATQRPSLLGVRHLAQQFCGTDRAITVKAVSKWLSAHWSGRAPRQVAQQPKRPISIPADATKGFLSSVDAPVLSTTSSAALDLTENLLLSRDAELSVSDPGLQDFTSEYQDVVDDTIESVIEQLPTAEVSLSVETTEEREIFHQEATLKLDLHELAEPPSQLESTPSAESVLSPVQVTETEDTVLAIPVEQPQHLVDEVPSRFAQMAFQASQQVGGDLAGQNGEFPLDSDAEFEEETFGVDETDVRQHIKTLSEDWNTRIYDEHTGRISPPEETNARDVTLASGVVQGTNVAQEAQMVPNLPEIDELEDEDWTSFFSDAEAASSSAIQVSQRGATLEASVDHPEETFVDSYFEAEDVENSAASKLDRPIFPLKTSSRSALFIPAIILLLLGFSIVTLWGTFRISKPSQVDKPVFEEVVTSSAANQSDASPQTIRAENEATLRPDQQLGSEDSTAASAVEQAPEAAELPTPQAAPQVKPVSENKAQARPKSAPKPVQSKPRPKPKPVQSKARPKPKPKLVKSKPRPKPKPKPQPVVEPTPVPAPEPPKPLTSVANAWGAPVAAEPEPVEKAVETNTKGTVRVTGSGVKVFLVRSGKSYAPGSLSTGRYRVDVQFDGAERFNLGAINVQDGQQHTISCNAQMMSCSF